MNRFFLLGVIILSLISSCKIDRAELTIEEDKLIKVLYDMHIAEAALFTVDAKLKDSVAAIYYQQIYSRHHVSDSLFKENMLILKDDHKKMHEIYKKIEALNNKVEKEHSNF